VTNPVLTLRKKAAISGPWRKEDIKRFLNEGTLSLCTARNENNIQLQSAPYWKTATDNAIKRKKNRKVKELFTDKVLSEFTAKRQLEQELVRAKHICNQRLVLNENLIELARSIHFNTEKVEIESKHSNSDVCAALENIVNNLVL